MEKLKDFLKQCPDWLLHIGVCLIGSLFFGFGFGIGAGLAGEYKDWAWGGKVSAKDLIADAFGTLVGGFINVLILREIFL